MKTGRKPIVVLPTRKTSGLFLRASGQYVADVQPDAGGRIIRRLGTDRARALVLWDDLVREIDDRENDRENPRFVDFLTGTFLPTQQRLKSYAFSEKSVQGVVRFLEASEPSLRIRDVRKHHVERLRSYYSERDYTPRTMNMFTQKLSQALNHATDLGLLDANPLARVRPLTVDNRRTRYLSMDEVVRILEAARDMDAYDLFLMAGLTGLRPSNLRMLTLGEVDLVQRVIRIPPDKMKNKRPGIIPVSQYVADLLAGRTDAATGTADTLVLPARGTGDKPKSGDNLSRSYRSVVRRLDGMEWSTLYDLRHFFASQLAKHGATEQQIGRLLCHVGQTVTSRYVHQDIEDLRHFVEEHSERVRTALGGETSILDKDAPAVRI